VFGRKNEEKTLWLIQNSRKRERFKIDQLFNSSLLKFKKSSKRKDIPLEASD